MTFFLMFLKQNFQYSNRGDRILTCSMYEGLVIVSSVTRCSNQILESHHNFPKLCSMNMHRDTPTTQKKHKTYCDSVAWSCDDKIIFTTQSCRADDNATLFLEGTHALCMWDSYTGDHLLRVESSHESWSSALVPHPILPMMITTAGSDGRINCWDLDKTDCFDTFLNPNCDGKNSPNGYLDVQFSPDGLNIVATDERGGITILGTTTPLSSNESKFLSQQYFTNDYLDLDYHQITGNCIIRELGMPPHLMPGSRCFEGPDGVQCYPPKLANKLHNISGPLPLPKMITRLQRDDIRLRGQNIHIEYNSLLLPKMKSRCKVIYNTDQKHIKTSKKRTVSQLSRNYRWGDAYEDYVSSDDNDDTDEDYEEGNKIEEDHDEYQQADNSGETHEGSANSNLKCSVSEGKSSSNNNEDRLTSTTACKYPPVDLTKLYPPTCPKWTPQSEQSVAAFADLILKKISDMDTMKLFSCETPSTSLGQSQERMDLGVMRKKLAHGKYKKMKDLQNDLIETLRYSCEYHGKELNGRYALAVWQNLSKMYNELKS